MRARALVRLAAVVAMRPSAPSVVVVPNAACTSSGFRISRISNCTPRLGRLLQFLDLRGCHGVGEVGQDDHACDAGHDLLQQLQTLGTEPRAHVGEPCDIAAGACEAVHESRPDGFPGAEQDDRDGPGGVLRGQGGRGGLRHDQVGLPAEAFAGQDGKPVNLAIRGQIINDDALALHVA